MTSLPTSRKASSLHNLPAEVSSFVGRGPDVDDIARMARHIRLLTLTGTGGSGKTRLALRAARELVPDFADGVWLVQLAPLTESARVPRAVATALGIHDSGNRPLLATLTTALASRKLLLVLDNCEHLIGAVARLAETLLRACPQLHILATSREPLRVPGESTWRVPPMAVSDPSVMSTETLADIEAVALFLDRARARQPEFTLSACTANAVATICCRLEGMPLAIELAAAQLGVLAPEQIASRLDRALHVLKGGSRSEPRQETLRAALDWSYALLEEAERTLFRRLAVLAGGFDVEAAEGVGSGDGIGRDEVLGLLSALVEKSLVEPRPDGAAMRYSLLEPVRQYALEHLIRRGELERLERRHAQYFTELVEAAEPKLMSGERGPWMEILARDQANLHAALAWSRRATEHSDIEVGLRLAGTLVFYWVFRGETSDGLEWVEAMLSRESPGSGYRAAPAVRAKALYGACELAWLAGQTALARERAEESEALWRALGEKRWLAYTLQSLPMAVDSPRARESVAESLRLFEEVGDAWGAALALATPDYFALMTDPGAAARGETRLQEALAGARSVKDDWITAQALNLLGDLARSQGDDVTAGARYEDALDLLRRQGLTGTVPSLLHNLGYVALNWGELRRALLRFRESLALFRDQGDQRGMADCLDGLACVLAVMKQSERAAGLFGTAEALRTLIGSAVWPGNAADRERGLARIRAGLDKGKLAAAWEAGRVSPISETVAEVLAEDAQSPSSGGGTEAGLTAREWEVATLVAQGLTNRQIGARLFITEGTARLHVKHILHKLGFASRAQIAAWMAERGMSAGQARQ
jgi:predicted ATPase/DNA-binding CsgD family transcriptional regulator